MLRDLSCSIGVDITELADHEAPRTIQDVVYAGMGYTVTCYMSDDDSGMMASKRN